MCQDTEVRQDAMRNAVYLQRKLHTQWNKTETETNEREELNLNQIKLDRDKAEA